MRRNYNRPSGRLSGSGKPRSGVYVEKTCAPRVQRDMELLRRYVTAFGANLRAQIANNARDVERARQLLHWLTSFWRDANRHPRPLSAAMLAKVQKYLKLDTLPPDPEVETPLGLRDLPKRPPHRMHELAEVKRG